MSESDPQSVRWPQFSLRTTLVLFIVLAVGVSLWLSKKQADENRRLQEENQSLHAQLRGVLGELEIKDADRNKLQAIAIRTLEPMTWKWRVYIPPGRKFNLHHEIRGVADNNLPDRGSFCGPIPAGEQIMTVALRKDQAKDDEWQWIVKCGSCECGPVLTGRYAAWINRPSNVAANWAGQHQPTIAPPDRPLEMLRYRSFPLLGVGQGSQSLTGVGDGILVWIQENKSPNAAAPPSNHP
jgi:hypothetical protein